ncbi:MAG: argininosuccinate lyase [Clostridiales bacterium]|nr:argininosuccinate lyase [Clostridiales bacterium]
MKLWSGRFEKETEASVDDFQSSIGFDQRLVREDIRGSIAHARMLGEQGIIPPQDAQAIVSGLTQLLADAESGALTLRADAEDIHMNIEQILTQRIGEAGKRLHTGRSRNDQVALDTRMYVIERTRAVGESIAALARTLAELAEKHAGDIMPGYTHLQRAQPVTLGFHMMAWVQMLLRDLSRLDECRRRTSVMPLGSGALAGTTYPLDRQRTAELLGFDAISDNAMDAVSDRDFVIECVFCLSLVMMHLSRMCEELILWSTGEFGFVEMDDGYSTGSSIMPQKKNPDVAELIRGKTGRVYGDLMALLTVMKGLPLAYNKDMQEDKEALFDALDTAERCLSVFTGMIRTARFRTDAMRRGAAGGFANATDAADYLVRRGLAFREAHAVVGAMVLDCIRQGRALEDLSDEELRSYSPLIGEDFRTAIDLAACVAGRDLPGGPARERVLESAARAREALEGRGRPGE